MSIWCSWEEIGHSDEGDKPRGEVRSYASGWSNHYPTVDVETPASVDIAHIAGWCVPGHQDEDENGLDWPVTGDWVRLSVHVQHRDWTTGVWGGYDLHSVVMDEKAARALAADLLKWADGPHVSPVGIGLGDPQ